MDVWWWYKVSVQNGLNYYFLRTKCPQNVQILDLSKKAFEIFTISSNIESDGFRRLSSLCQPSPSI